jgi:hypothetical protein
MMADIDIARLQRITNDLFERLKGRGVTSVALDADYYWEVPQQLRYDNHGEPGEHEMGRLGDDLQFLEEMLDGTRPPVSFGLVWVAALLRYVGEKIVA